MTETDQPPIAGADPTRSRWLPAAAAAAVVLVAAGVVGAVALHRAAAPEPPAPPPDRSAVVHDGDRVRGQGQVVAQPGQPVRLCVGAVAVTATAVTDGPAPRSTAGCRIGVDLVGADLDRLTGRQESAGVVSGAAQITGIYRTGTVTVTGQAAPPAPLDWTLALERLPADCPAPAGGWPVRTAQDLPGIGQVSRYVDAHPDVLGGTSFGYPQPGKVRPQVLLVGTTGDAGELTRTVRRWYAGPLCVRAVAHSRSDLAPVRATLQKAVGDPARSARYGLIGGAGEGTAAGEPRTNLTVVVHDQPVEDLVRSAGADLVEVEPVLAKVA
jgi:hypothetical protein